jgi:hypothetical protein
MTKTKTSKFLVYGLTCPDTGEVRYIGRSSMGLERPKEHANRLYREKTYKASWIRSLLQAGKSYGIVVLQECESVAETIQAEIVWIKKGRSAGWRLTNLTDGGEGAAVMMRPDVTEEAVVRLYEQGMSELAISKHLNVNRCTVARRLKAANVKRRTGSEAHILRMARMTPEERKALAAPAHAACRRKGALRRKGSRAQSDENDE